MVCVMRSIRIACSKRLTETNWNQITLTAKRLKGLIDLVKCNSLALQQGGRLPMPWNDTDREKDAVLRERYETTSSDDEERTDGHPRDCSNEPSYRSMTPHTSSDTRTFSGLWRDGQAGQNADSSVAARLR
jgi:hypothetical protein